MVQPRKTCPFITERLLMGRKESNQTDIKLPFGIKIFVLSILEWPFYTGFTVISHVLIYSNLRVVG